MRQTLAQMGLGKIAGQHAGGVIQAAVGDSSLLLRRSHSGGGDAFFEGFGGADDVAVGVANGKSAQRDADAVAIFVMEKNVGLAALARRAALTARAILRAPAPGPHRRSPRVIN